MSQNINESLLKLIRELVEQELEETTSSGAAGPYNTPYAFRGNTADGKAKAKKNATQAGMTLVDKTPEKADDAGTQEVETVPFGDKGKGGLKKPKDEPKPKIEENDAVKRNFDSSSDQLKGIEDSIKSWERKKSEAKTPAERKLADERIRDWKTKLSDRKKRDAENKSTKTEVVQENRYMEFKMSEGTPSQKIGKAIREINRQISEVDRVLRMNERLKQESGTNGEQLWKSTARGLTKLEGRMNTLSARIRNLKA